MKRETQRTNSEPTDLHDTSHVDASGYLRRGGYVFIGVCLFVCLLAGSHKNYLTDFYKIRWKGSTEEIVTFRW